MPIIIWYPKRDLHVASGPLHHHTFILLRLSTIEPNYTALGGKLYGAWTAMVIINVKSLLGLVSSFSLIGHFVKEEVLIILTVKKRLSSLPAQ